MKYLYIPTSTLNFNNILSSESISPESFYKERNFGYHHWYSIPENENTNVILLYDSKCFFKRPTSDLEDHPLLIQVRIDEKSLSKYADGVYYSDHTIYLDPWNNKFIFFSSEEKKITLSMSDSSLETKVIQLHRKNNMPVEEKKPQQEYPIVEFKHIDLNTIEIENDFRINRMKGFLYGYYIGALLSLDKETVKKLSKSKESLNILSAIESSIEKRATNHQSERLNFLLKDILTTGDLYKNLSEINDSKNDSINLKLIDWINKKITQLESEKGKKRLSPDESEVVIIENNLSSITTLSNKLEQKLFKEWVNTILTSKKYDHKINSFRKELSDDITLKAKDIFATQWRNSDTQKFLNKLRHHIGGESFDVEWNNGLLSSVAAVVLKGEDWNKLLTFMQTKGMYDYRLAFSMYGALNGFANLTRDFTDLLFSCDSKYIADVYTEFHGQLFGERLDTNLKKEKVTQEAEETSSTQTPGFDTFFKSICTKCTTVRKDENNYKKHYQKHGGLTPDFLNAIKQDKTLNKGKGVQKGVISNIEKLLNPSNKKTRKQKNEKDSNFSAKSTKSTHTQNRLPFENTERFDSYPKFNLDNLEYIRQEIENCTPTLTDKVKDLLEEDLKWILDPSFSKNCSNEDAIQNFHKKLIEGKTQPVGRRGGDQSWKNKLYEELDIETIITHLKEVF